MPKIGHGAQNVVVYLKSGPGGPKDFSVVIIGFQKMIYKEVTVEAIGIPMGIPKGILRLHLPDFEQLRRLNRFLLKKIDWNPKVNAVGEKTLFDPTFQISLKNIERC